jgi:long-chain fatty acid transport protein
VTRAALALALALVLASAASAQANALDTFGFGARAGGMGGAQTAATRDVGANYYNPAVLALLPDVELDLGTLLAHPALHMNGGDQRVNDSFGYTLGLAAPGRLLGQHVGFGVAAYVPDAQATRVRALPGGEPRWVLYDNRPQRLYIGAHVAFSLGKHVFIGGGVAFLARLVGDLELIGRIGFPTPDDSQLDLAIDVDLRSIRYPEAGILVRPTPWLDLGLTYRGGFVLEIDEVLGIDGDVGAAGATPIVDDGFLHLHAISLDHFQPAQLAFGFSARVSPRVLVAGDLTWQRWSAYRNPTSHIDLDLDLKDFNDQVHLTPQLEPPGAFFHDIVVPKLGTEIDLSRGPAAIWRLRAGYAYEPSPAPEQQGQSNFIDGDKHTFTVGAGVEVAHVTALLPRPFHLDVFAGLTVIPERTHHKLLANDPVGDLRAGGQVWQVGVSTRWTF